MSRARGLRRLGLCAVIIAAILGTPGRLPAGQGTNRLHVREAGDTLLVTVATASPVVTEAAGLPGYRRVTIPGLPATREIGRPEMPYRVFLIGVPEGTVPVATATTAGGVSLGRHRLAPGLPRPAVAVEEPGPIDPAADPWEDDAVYGRRGGLWPDDIVEVRSTGVLRDQPIAEIRVHPVTYRPGDDEVIHHPSIQVAIRFVRDGGAAAAPRLDPEPDTGGPEHLRSFDRMLRSSLVNYPMVSRDRARRRMGRLVEASGPVTDVRTAGGSTSLTGAAGAVKILVSQDGLYQVTPAMLTGAGVDVTMVDPRTFALRAGGADVPILVDGEADGSFDPADRVILFGSGIHGDRFTRTNVYYLSFNDAAGPRIAARSGTFTGAAPTPASFATTVHAEQNAIYTSLLRAGVTEQWYWKRQSQGASTDALDYPITLPHVDPAAHTINVRARMLGLTSTSHTPELSLNATLLAQNTFSGQVTFNQSATAASSLIASGGNTLTLTLGGAAFEQIASDFFEIDYRRTYAVDADQLMFDGEGTGAVHIALTGLGSNDPVLLDVTTPGAPQQIIIPAGQIAGGPPFTASFEDILPSERVYAIATRGGLRSPAAVVPEIPSNLVSSANGADYIIVTDRSLLAAMEPLASFRAGQGLRTALVATDDIYDEFNDGLSSPQAIRDFLSYAYASWAPPAPAFVLLAGDGHIDYRDDYGSGTPQIVPPILGAFTAIGEAPADNRYVAVAGADNFPEMFVGRLPIRSVADATTVVGNIIAYETAPPVAGLNDQTLYVADNNDPIFQAILENLQAFMPAGMGAAEAYLPGGDPANPPTPAQINATTDAVFAGLNTGSLLSMFFGHGNVPFWASEKVVEHNPNPATGSSARLDMGRLTASGHQTFMLALNCINGYFVDLAGAGPGHVDYALAEEWLRRPARGAIASWGPSALGSIGDYDSISYEMFSHLYDDRMTTVGPLATAALIDAVGIFSIDTDNIDSMHLFGDPATRLALDTDADGLVDYLESAAGSDPLDGDSDDDGLADGPEVLQHATSPVGHDTDGDLIADGTERGVVTPLPGTDTGAGRFVPDADPLTTTDPADPDTDGGGVSDGAEDLNRDGAVGAGETDPNDPQDDLACPGPLPEVTNLVVTRSGDDVVLSWDAAAAVPCATYRIYAAAGAPWPKSSFAPFSALADTSSPGYTHPGAAAGSTAYDYLVRVVHPQLGEGPLGSYGQ